MSLTRQASRALSLFEDSRAIKSLLSWPAFSLTSFLMISRLAKQQIVPVTIIDIGANIGQFAVASAKLFPGVAIHCFEPNPESVARLSKNLSKLPNTFVYPIACGERNGEVEFRVNAYSPSSSILPLGPAHKAAFPRAEEKATINVKLSTLDDALDGVPIEHPTLLKIDVQGYESNTLLGAKKTLRQIDYVVIETAFKPMYEGDSVFADVCSILEADGFRFARPVDFATAQGTGEITHIDALFVRNSHG
jgi:FkbM family methyltransferase